MPVNVVDEFEEEEKKRQEQQAKEKEAREFGELVLKAAQPSFDNELKYTRYPRESGFCLDEYRVNATVPKTGGWLRISRLLHRSETRKRLVAQVVRNKKDADYDFEIVVFSPEHREMASKIAALLPLVYGDRIKIHVTRNLVIYY